MFKKCLLVVASIVCMLVVSTNVFADSRAQPQKSFDEVAAKHAMVEKYKDKQKTNMSKEEKINYSRKVGRIIAEDVANGVSTDQIKQDIKAYDAYVMDAPDSSGTVQPFSQSGDVTLNKPMITYLASSNEWLVTGGGYWNTTNWYNDGPQVWWGYNGETKNEGNPDSVGLAYYQTSSYSSSVQVIDSYGYFTDHNGWTYDTHNPSHGDGSKGVAFDIQDVMKVVNWQNADTPSGFTYLGDGFAAQLTYNSNFANYHGLARTMYIHTWSSAIINSISFGVSGKQFGAAIDITNKQYSFNAFDPSDASF